MPNKKAEESGTSRPFTMATVRIGGIPEMEDKLRQISDKCIRTMQSLKQLLSTDERNNPIVSAIFKDLGFCVRATKVMLGQPVRVYENFASPQEE